MSLFACGRTSALVIRLYARQPRHQISWNYRGRAPRLSTKQCVVGRAIGLDDRLSMAHNQRFAVGGHLSSADVSRRPCDALPPNAQIDIGVLPAIRVRPDPPQRE
jgi:hypothetical protein